MSDDLVMHYCGLRKDYDQPYIFKKDDATLIMRVIMDTGLMYNVDDEWKIEYCPFCGNTIQQMKDFEEKLDKSLEENRDLLKRLADDD